MIKSSRFLLYTLLGSLFIISLIGMLVYGYKTFYIEKKALSEKEYDYHFALVSEEVDNEYWRLIEAGAKQFAEEHNIYLEYIGPQRANNEQLLNLLDRMIAVKVDGIITQGVEGERFARLALKGAERGIPIITVDTDVNSSVRKAYVGTDNFHAGELIGQAIIENTKGKQAIGVVMGRYDGINQQERMKGLEAAIKEEERLEIVAIAESNITQVGAAQATYSLLKEHPHITTMVGTSALDGIGIVEAVEEIAPNRGLYIVAFDILLETLALLEAERIDATIVQFPEEMGYQAMKAMRDLQFHELIDTKIMTETQVLEKATLDLLQQGDAK